MPRKLSSVRLPLVWLMLAVVLSTGVYFTLKWGLRAKPIPQINPTGFESPEQIGVVLYRRLREPLRQEKLIVLGGLPSLHSMSRVWNGFIAAAREDNYPISMVLKQPGLEPLKDFSGVEFMDLPPSGQRTEFLSGLDGRLIAGRLVIVYVSEEDSSHRVKNSLVNGLEERFKRPWMSVTLMPFPVSAEELDGMQPACADEMANAVGIDYLACSAARHGRRYLRKHFAEDALWASAERHGLKEYLVFIHEPMKVNQ